MATELRKVKGRIGRIQSHLFLRRNVHLGELGEWIALGYFLRLKWDILARNWRTKKGELDLIGFDGSVLVFAEVKTRRLPHLLPPEASIDENKTDRIEALAYSFLRQNDLNDADIRFDLVAIEVEGWRDYRLRHYLGFM